MAKVKLPQWLRDINVFHRFEDEIYQREDFKAIDGIRYVHKDGTVFYSESDGTLHLEEELEEGQYRLAASAKEIITYRRYLEYTLSDFEVLFAVGKYCRLTHKDSGIVYVADQEGELFTLKEIADEKARQKEFQRIERSSPADFAESKPESYLNSTVIVVPAVSAECNQYLHIKLTDQDLKLLPAKTLTPVELKILRCLMNDVPIKAIAAKVGRYNSANISVVLARMRQKFGVETNHGLIAKAYQMGFSERILY
ncbi:helix-turn-helix transcriptional regulator [Caedibacter taeniospiralis]|uniref:Putative bacterial regulatory protein n=1 Tax=Caedibacter taeniospiralis TaxID=28907 RepID=Q6TFE4_CAETA|nr:transcriptional regulator [Caedibacter taeniospiralis]AAR87115.1 putative bacterial regulatory protein [Caedibacter taeniospiralis]